jgi:hypothetical protein
LGFGGRHPRQVKAIFTDTGNIKQFLG